MADRTRGEWRRDLARIEKAWGRLSVAGLQPKHILKMRDAYARTPAAANNLIKCLSALLTWSIPRGWRNDNPCSHIRKLKIGAGYAPWDWKEIGLFQTIARRDLWFAAAIALYTGQRLADVLKLRWDEIEQGLISVVQNKTGKRLWIPIHGELRKVLEEVPRRGPTILTNTRGRQWTTMGFKASWSAELNREALTQLRTKRLVFHGLRKSAVVSLLEAGCTDAEVAAITGQSRQMVEHYARGVNQTKLAASAVAKWEGAGPHRAKADSS